MKLIKYTFVNSRYARDDQEISEETARKELNKYQLEKLQTTGKCNIRNKTKKSGKQTKLDKIYESDLHLYRIFKEPIRGEMRYELQRKHPNGYFNILCYVETNNLDDCEELIKEDIKKRYDLKGV